MAILKVIDFKKKQYADAYIKIEDFQVHKPNVIESIKHYPVSFTYTVYADNLKDVILYQEKLHVGFMGVPSLDKEHIGFLESELNLPSFYTYLKSYLGDCTDAI